MLNSLYLLLPEVTILLMACFILVAALFTVGKSKNFLYLVTQVTLVVVFILFLFNYMYLDKASFFVYGNSFVFDKFNNSLKIIIVFFTFFIFTYSQRYIVNNNIKEGDYYSLCLFSLLGMFLLVSSGNLLVFYLSIELMSLPLYTLIAMIMGYSTSQESAFKYFILGSVASSLLLFGISLVYGMAGSISFTDIFIFLSSNYDVNTNLILQSGCFLIVFGLVFKLGVAPFHVWVPDVYKGSAVPVTILISTIPKIAVFGIFLKLLNTVFLTLYVKFLPLLIIMSVLSLFIGNVFALAQTNIKKLFAYSSISHIGFVILGLVSLQERTSVSVSLFYLFIYVMTTLGSFSLLLIFCKDASRELENLSDLKGFATTNPLIAFFLAIFLFSMAGIPPLVGFYAKLLVLNNVISAGFLWLALFSVLMTVIGLFYYLRVVKVMYFDSVEEHNYVYNITMSKFGVILLSFNSLIILILGVYPNPVLWLCSFICSN